MAVSAPARPRPPVWVDVLLGATTAVCLLTLVPWVPLTLLVGIAEGHAQRGYHRPLWETLLIWDLLLYPLATPVLLLAAWEVSTPYRWIAALLSAVALVVAIAVWVPAVWLMNLMR